MTKRDFELIADVILGEHKRHKYADVAVLDAVDNVAIEFADRLRRTNPAFDRARFLKACGVER